MQIGVVGLGRMGLNITRRLMKAGHQCLAFDVNASAVTTARGEGAMGAASLADLVKAFDQSPRVIWLMLPAGRITDEAITTLAELLSPGDILIDGGNTHFKDDIRRANALAPRQIRYVDCGTSGGIWGAERGYCLMIGGPKDAVSHLDPIFRALAPGLGDIPRTPGREGEPSQAEQGYIHAGPTGAGHFVKMIHNGIEYGLMQAYAEGFDILRGRASSDLPEGERYDLNLPDIAEVWRRGSVVTSWLLDLSATALIRDPDLKSFSGEVADSGEGRWTIETAIEQATPANVLSASLFARFRSRQKSYADKLLSAMRLGFGGHVETKPADKKEG
ncbi:MAG: 6-phosphogluconate dehydrogenase (decarboxylating) [Rhizobiales bacterium 62-17]|nr:decarboxylating 6-phosphogluconate dehydrogenase [Hyphomicrobiales bacterium]OJY05546.1 MAG: 6-phosphogluconate dehydrogenase (decarboxylating) [Rhizobiales bacterium 62-17]